MNTLNGFRVTSLRIVQRWRGPWYADASVDPDTVTAFQASGPASIVIGAAPGVTIIGTFDPLASGSFVASAMVRVLGGAGGWSREVPGQDFSVASGVTSTSVYQATAAIVGETVQDLAPASLGLHYARSQGPASRVLDGVDWWVDPVTGTTFVGPRPIPTADPSLELLDWDPLRKVAIVSCDALVVPGTVLTDSRIGEGSVTIRDVEQVFDAKGSRATCWCSVNASSPLVDAFRRMVAEFSNAGTLAIRQYRVLQASGGANQWALQAVDRVSGGAPGPFPDLIPVTAWGAPGLTATLPPSLDVLVGFVAADPGRPVLFACSPEAIPLALTLDASGAVKVGPSAAAVAIAGGGGALTPAAWAEALAAALVVFATGLNSTTLVGQAAALVTALGALPPAATTRTTAT
jgi:hypothetical protein